MGRRQVIDCDGCPATDIYCPQPVCVDVDHRADGAGSMEDVTEQLWLCADCLRHVLEGRLKLLDHAEAKRWVAEHRRTK